MQDLWRRHSNKAVRQALWAEGSCPPAPPHSHDENPKPIPLSFSILLHLSSPPPCPKITCCRKKKVTFKVLRNSFNKLWKSWKVTGLSFPSPLPLTTAVATASNTAGQRGIAPPVLHGLPKHEVTYPLLCYFRLELDKLFYRQPVRLPHKLSWLLASSRLWLLIFVGTHWK